MTIARTGVLFVCLGNICRSPLAEAVFVHLARQRGLLDAFDIDSAGLGDWHVGDRADPRTIEIGRRHGVDVFSIARQVNAKRDFPRFTWLIAMDRSHIRGLVRLGADPAQIRLMMAFSPTVQLQTPIPGRHDVPIDAHDIPDVPDPYQGAFREFEQVYDMLVPACQGLLDWLIDQPRSTTP
ncbi:MAG: low molecular weight phosphotyrosine protein phosphatase [Phycisphaeraceae bacterium]|nr:low molecular weight phosphotyrosine protein phosphatase [Phycisphaeraceae bacterium]MCW5753320.1 low molecular weight phosphotyrosine protein phosphatase [Phycisphaeraceae bacterium]